MRFIASAIVSILIISIIGLIASFSAQVQRESIYSECAANGKAVLPSVGWIQCTPFTATVSVTIRN